MYPFERVLPGTGRARSGNMPSVDPVTGLDPVATFEPLYTRFVRATRAMATAREDSGPNPFVASEARRFEAEVVAPMEAAWARLTQAQQEIFWNREHPESAPGAEARRRAARI